MLKLGYKSKKVVSIKNSIYYRSIFYVVLMAIYGVLGYLFLDSGFNTKTKVKVNYEDSSDVVYKVNYFDKEYTNSLGSNKYVSEMVDYIDFSYNYNNILSEYVSGYYRYNVESYLVAYEDDISNSLWERKYQLVEDKTIVLDKNNINNIKIDDNFKIDFKKYRDEINRFIDEYDIDVSGYLHIRINILQFLNFDSLDNEYTDNKVITINIPITDDTFKIRVNNISNMNSYYEFSSKKAMNIVFLIIGAFCLSLSAASLIMVIKQFGIIYKRQSEYNRELKRILAKYDDCIVRVNRFYTYKKYNMIYVDSFSELMDVYDKKNKMISFKEVKRGSEALFVIIDEDDAWIYRMCLEKE